MMRSFTRRMAPVARSVARPTRFSTSSSSETGGMFGAGTGLALLGLGAFGVTASAASSVDITLPGVSISVNVDDKSEAVVSAAAGGR